MNTSNESDFGTPETQKQGGGVTKGYSTESGKVARVRHQCPFDIIYHRGHIDDKQFIAGDRLRTDGYISGKFPYVKSSADFSVKGNRLDDPTTAMINASECYKNALASLDRYEASIAHLIIMEEGYLKWISDRKLRLNAMTILRSALDTLVKHYRM